MPLYPPLPWKMGFPGGSEGKASACNAGDPVPSLGWDDPLEKEMATHSSILAWRIHGQKSLIGYSPRGCKESDTTEWLLSFLSSMKNSIIGILVWQLLFLDTPISQHSWVALSTAGSDRCSCAVVLPLLSYCFNSFFSLVFCSLGMGLFYFFPGVIVPPESV